MKLTPVPNIVIKWTMNSIAMAALGGIVIDGATRCHNCNAQGKAKYCLQYCLREDEVRCTNIACKIVSTRESKIVACTIACNDCLHTKTNSLIINCPQVRSHVALPEWIVLS